MKKVITLKEAVDLIKEGATIMIAGFLDCGCPMGLVDALADKGTKNLTLISNDTSTQGRGKGKLIVNKQVKKVITTHIGTNSDTVSAYNGSDIEFELTPMGTLVERIRAKGAGLGGVLTPTGVGTVLEKGKRVVEIDGKKFIFEKPLGADIALIYGTKVDKFGNVAYFGTTRNCNTVMATAAETVIVEADEIVDCLDPNDVVIPGVFVDYIVKSGN